jgi:YegS/Rv2252/BmrU family lipid kinase
MPRELPRIEQLVDTADEVVILRNRAAGRGPSGDRLRALVDDLSSRRFRPDVFSDVGPFRARTRELMERKRLRAVIAAGGDGTADLVVNGLPDGVALGVFPLGTENLLAKYLNLGQRPGDVAAAIGEGRVARMDVGELSANGRRQLFLLMLGIGFDAEVVHRLHSERTGHISHLSYTAPILQSIRSYDYPPIQVSIHDVLQQPPTRVVTARWVFVFNCPSYAVNLEICPEAVPYDGCLDLVTFQEASFWQGLALVGSVLVGQHRRRAGAEWTRAKCLRIEAESTVKCQVDGDPGGDLPVEVRVLPEHLRVIVPRVWLDRRLADAPAKSGG